MLYRFFAYGAFTQGQVHYSKFSQLIQDQRKAFIKADVYRLRCGFPMLQCNSSGALVEGTLFELEAPESFWPIVDELLGVDLSRQEKCFINRSEEEVLFDNFSKERAMVYSINPKKITKAHRKIPEGDWQVDLKRNPPLISTMQDRHKDYIAKLSRCRGRDIVPIKLDLYRELLSLEMIVDKGRRLALTPLGKEASLFIQ